MSKDKLEEYEIERIKQVAFYELEDNWNSIRNELNKEDYVSRYYLIEKFEPIFYNLNCIKTLLKEGIDE